MADLTPDQHAALRYAIALLRMRGPQLPDEHRQVEALHLLALQNLLGHAVGNRPENLDGSPILTRTDREERRGSLAGHEAPIYDFPVETPEGRARVAQLIEEHRDADPASRIGQWVTVMMARVRAYDDSHDEAIHPDPEDVS